MMTPYKHFEDKFDLILREHLLDFLIESVELRRYANADAYDPKTFNERQEDLIAKYITKIKGREYEYGEIQNHIDEQRDS